MPSSFQSGVDVLMEKINKPLPQFFWKNSTSYRMMPVLELLWPGSVKMDPTETPLRFLVPPLNFLCVASTLSHEISQRQVAVFEFKFV